MVTRARGEQVWHEKLLLWPVRTGCSQGYGYWRTAAVPFEKKLYVNGTTYFF